MISTSASVKHLDILLRSSKLDNQCYLISEQNKEKIIILSLNGYDREGKSSSTAVSEEL